MQAGQEACVGSWAGAEEAGFKQAFLGREFAGQSRAESPLDSANASSWLLFAGCFPLELGRGEMGSCEHGGSLPSERSSAPRGLFLIMENR